MGRFVPWAAVGLLLAAAGRADAAPEDGARIFAAQKCAMCHSIAGKGNSKGSLDGVGTRLAAADVRLWLVSPKEMADKQKAARKPPMKSFAALPKEDLDALVSYLMSLKGGK